MWINMLLLLKWVGQLRLLTPVSWAIRNLAMNCWNSKKCKVIREKQWILSKEMGSGLLPHSEMMRKSFDFSDSISIEMSCWIEAPPRTTMYLSILKFNQLTFFLSCLLFVFYKIKPIARKRRSRWIMFLRKGSYLIWGFQRVKKK